MFPRLTVFICLPVAVKPDEMVIKFVIFLNRIWQYLAVSNNSLKVIQNLLVLLILRVPNPNRSLTFIYFFLQENCNADHSWRKIIVIEKISIKVIFVVPKFFSKNTR